MKKYILHISQTAVQLLFLLLLLSILVFFLSRLAPGDPLQSFYGDATQSMSAEALDAARQRLGLDGSLWQQYGAWLHNALQGDFGISLKYKRPALDVILSLLGNTLILGGCAYILIFVFSLMLALLCVRYENHWIDRWLCRLGTMSFHIPTFWLGVVLILIFSVNLRILPSSGAYSLGNADNVVNRLHHLILPLFVMVLGHVWYYAALLRNRLLEEVRCDYVLLARAKGLGKNCVLVRHCLRSVFPALISLMAISVPHILGGTYVAEAVFHYPGIGLLAISSAKYHDYNVLMLMALLTGSLVLVSSCLAQRCYEAWDPRLKQHLASRMF